MGYLRRYGEHIGLSSLPPYLEEAYCKLEEEMGMRIPRSNAGIGVRSDYLDGKIANLISFSQIDSNITMKSVPNYTVTRY